MDDKFKEKLRGLKVDVLRFLLVLCVTKSFALELDEISKSTSTSEPELRGVLGTIRRLKINGKSMIIPAGRDSDGRYRWRIDESVVNKNDLAKFLENEVLGKDSLSFKK